MTDYRHVYVHVPFCARRCSYCDFAISVRKSVPAEQYVDALLRELQIRATREAITPANEALRSLYFGGGTPSHLGPDAVRRLVVRLAEQFGLEAGAEVTLEVNPEDVSAAAVASWRAAGVNRISLGVQSFDDAVLSWMHRVHDAEAARRAYRLVRDGGIENVSVDLIFSVPSALRRDWRRDLDEALLLYPEHVSLYGLTIEERTPLSRWAKRGDAIEAPEEAYEAQFLLADVLLTETGYEHYEVSNFARPGRRAVHNSAYWSLAPYLGLGPSAHGFDGATRRWNERHFDAWCRRVERDEDPVAGCETLTHENRIAEDVYLGLRTSDGLDVSASELGEVASWMSAGWIERVATRDVTESAHGAFHERVRCTATGWLRLDSLAANLTQHRSR